MSAGSSHVRIAHHGRISHARAHDGVSELMIDSPNTHTLTQFYVGPDGQRMRVFSIAHTRRR